MLVNANNAACLVIFVVLAPPVALADSGWLPEYGRRIYNPANNTTFIPIDDLDWSAAEAVAVGMGGHLASIHSHNESLTAWESINTGDGWIGLNDIAVEGALVWTDGSPVDYTNWYPGGPGHFAPDADATLVGGSLQVPPIPATWRLESTSTKVQYPGIVQVSGNHAGVTGPNGHTYFLIAVESWETAEVQAVALGGHLASISDAVENAFVESLMPPHGGEAWIGLHDPQHDGTFEWSDGSPLSYSNWLGAPGQHGSQFIVHMVEGAGKWNDAVQGGGFPVPPLLGIVEVVPEPSAIFLFLSGGFIVALVQTRRSRLRSS